MIKVFEARLVVNRSAHRDPTFLTCSGMKLDETALEGVYATMILGCVIVFTDSLETVVSIEHC